MRTILINVIFCFTYNFVLGQKKDTINSTQYIRVRDSVFYNSLPYSGVAKKFDKVGKLIGIEIYQNGVANGSWIEWYSTGEKKFEGQFQNGKPFGNWTEWYIDGKIKLSINMQIGE
ncbi:MAG: putative antitoxin YwqK [Bacteroidota bacterium]